MLWEGAAHLSAGPVARRAGHEQRAGEHARGDVGEESQETMQGHISPKTTAMNALDAAYCSHATAAGEETRRMAKGALGDGIGSARVRHRSAGLHQRHGREHGKAAPDKPRQQK